MLSNIKIVLVRTFHPGNIGSVARSMKTMGLSDLHLVAPKNFPAEQATQMAAGAEDVLSKAHISSDLPSAISDCTFVAATSARPRGYDLPLLSPQQAAQMVIEHALENPVAVVFGPERMGLHNDDIQHAKYRIEIPANPEYPSLNLASAVQIVAYEIRKASLANNSKPARKSLEAAPASLPTSKDIERLHTHIEEVLLKIEFLRPHQGETLLRIRNLLARAEPDILEVNILRGILSSMEKQIPEES